MPNRDFARTCHLSILLFGTVLGSGWAVPGFAQFYPDRPPPVREQLDSNGVNLTTGEQFVFQTEVSIGSPGRQGMAFVRKRGWNANTSNYNLSIFQQGTTWWASAGLRSYKFAQNGNVFNSTDGSGATLIKSGNIYILTAPDGTKITYDFLVQDSTDILNQIRGTLIEYPSGEKETLSWNWHQWCSNYADHCAGGTWIVGVRLQSVRNTLGYMLHFGYDFNGVPVYPDDGTAWRRRVNVKAINLGVDYCAPVAVICATTQAWPTATYAPTGDSVTDSEGRTTTYARTSNSLSVWLPGSASPNYVANFAPNATSPLTYSVTSVTNAGVSTAYQYSVSGTVATMVVTDALSQVTTVVSDLNVGLPTSINDPITAPAGRPMRYRYDGSGRLTHIIPPEGNVDGSGTPTSGYTKFTYDGRGNVTETRSVAKAGSTLQDIVSKATFPPNCANPVTCNLPTSTTDPRNFVTDYFYDPVHGGVTTVMLPAPDGGPLRPTTTYAYQSVQAYYKNSAGSIVGSGQPLTLLSGTSTCQTLANCTGLADQVVTSIDYGPQTTGTANNLQPVSTTRRNGNSTLVATTTLTYDHVGNLLTVDGPLPNTAQRADRTRYRYNANRELVGVVGPDPDGTAGPRTPQAVRYTYEAGTGLPSTTEIGTVASQSDADWPGFAWAYRYYNHYDINRRVDRQTLSSPGVGPGPNVDHAVVDYLHDALGRPRCAIQYMDPAQWGPYASACAPLQVNGPHGPDRVVRTDYDAVGRPVKITEAVGVAGQEAATQQLSYTLNGLPREITDGEGNRSEHVYDGFDRLDRLLYPHASTGAPNASDTLGYSYDPGSNVTQIRLRGWPGDGNQKIDFTYDNLGRVKTRKPGSEATATYGYDLLGRVLTISGSTTLTFTWDALGRQLSDGQPFGTVSYQYDLAGRRTRLAWHDGNYVHYAYDDAGNVTAIQENTTTPGAAVLASYAYDNLGRPTGVSYLNGTSRSYAWDAASRLSGLGINLSGTAQDLTLGLSYNPAGQIVETTRSNVAYAWTGHADRVRDFPADRLNRIAQIVTTPVTGTPSTVVPGYDARGNLTSAGTGSYGYSPDNLLRTAPGGTTLHYDPLGRLHEYNTHVSTRFLFDGGMIVAEIHNPSGAIQRRYVPGPGTDDPVVLYEGPFMNERRFLQADERGSIVAISNNAGTSVAVNRYDDYGNPGAGNVGLFQYTGQVWLPEAGVHYYKARMYHPGLGRFLQTDPIGYVAGMNLYAYVGNDPVNLVDPTGLCTAADNRGWFNQCLAMDGIDDIIVTGQRLTCGDIVCVSALDRFDLMSSGGGIGSGIQFHGGGGGGGGTTPQKNEVRSKRQICNALSRSKYDVRKAWTIANTARKMTTSGKTNWNNPFLRESENWLTAASDYFTLPFAKTAQIYIHQYQKTLPFSNTTPFSQEALDAGLDGLRHLGDTPEQLEDWCNEK